MKPFSRMFLIVSGLVLMVAPAAWTQTDDPLRLGTNVVPVFQKIHLNLDPAADRYAGSTEIELRVT